MSDKPRLKVVAGRPVVIDAEPIDKVARARQRHGKPFAHEPGSNYKPNEVPVLTRWMQSRGRT